MTLSDYILSNMGALLREWESYAASIPSSAGMDTAALRDDAQAMLKAIAHDIAEAQSAQQQEAKSKGQAAGQEQDTAAKRHASNRQSEGFSLNEMVSEYRALRASVIRLWTRDLTSADRETLYEMTRFNEAIDQALAESIARYSQRLDRSRELFLGVLGHDMRSPLGAVLNSAGYLLHAEGLSGAQTKAVSAIVRAGTRLQDMTCDLLDVARTRLGQSLPIAPAELDLASSCEQAIEEARAYHPDRVIAFSAPRELRGTWDGARLRQMLSNLVENAIRHGSPGKPVIVTVSAQGSDALVSVHNEGRPIPEPLQRRIFEPLVRSDEDPVDHGRAGSLGLGLYIVRIIVEAHGGSIEVASSNEDGTTFTARLPGATGEGPGDAPPQ